MPCLLDVVLQHLFSHKTWQLMLKLGLPCSTSRTQSPPQPDPQLFLMRKYGLPDASSVP